MTVRFLEAARDDLREGVRYYDSQLSGLGGEFRKEVRAAITCIQRLPFAWPDIGEGFRRHLIHRFPYGILYHLRGDVILIVSVAHLHREPRHWRDRTTDLP